MRNRARFDAVMRQDSVKSQCEKAGSNDSYKTTNLFVKGVKRSLLVGALALGLLMSSGCGQQPAVPTQSSGVEQTVSSQVETTVPSQDIGLGGEQVGEKEVSSTADVFVYKAPDSVADQQKEFIKKNVDEMRLVAYNRLGQLQFTEHFLPSGHKIYRDDAHQGWIFSGRTLIKVDLSGVDLNDSKSPIYSDAWMDYVQLPDFAVLRTEDGFDITRNDISPIDVTDPSASFTKVKLNGTDVKLGESVVEGDVVATTDSIQLSVFGVKSLEDAKALFDESDVETHIDGKEFKILNANTYSHHWCVLAFDGESTFAIQLTSLDTPLSYEDNTGAVYVKDNAAYEGMLKDAYGKEFKGQFKSLVAEVDKTQQVYDPTTKTIEDVTAIQTDDQGGLVVSSDVLKNVFGLRMMMDGDTLCLQSGSRANELGVELGYVEDNLCNDGILQFYGCSTEGRSANIAQQSWKATVKAEEIRAAEKAKQEEELRIQQEAQEKARQEAEAALKAEQEKAASSSSSSQPSSSNPEKPAEKPADSQTSESTQSEPQSVEQQSGKYALNEYGNPSIEVLTSGAKVMINPADPALSRYCCGIKDPNARIPNPFAKMEPISPYKGQTTPPTEAQWPRPQPSGSGDFRWDSATGTWRYHRASGKPGTVYVSIYGVEGPTKSMQISAIGQTAYNNAEAKYRGVID